MKNPFIFGLVVILALAFALYMVDKVAAGVTADQSGELDSPPTGEYWVDRMCAIPEYAFLEKCEGK